ncbi:hypothetical protein EDC01DRAFT_635176 [Geopyxis carbonaria]|nr:hypothetical protein EDC01DRAFT_635176 [Geopyxis carbonaria]
MVLEELKLPNGHEYDFDWIMDTDEEGFFGFDDDSEDEEQPDDPVIAIVPGLDEDSSDEEEDPFYSPSEQEEIRRNEGPWSDSDSSGSQSPRYYRDWDPDTEPSDSEPDEQEIHSEPEEQENDSEPEEASEDLQQAEQILEACGIQETDEQAQDNNDEPELTTGNLPQQAAQIVPDTESDATRAMQFQEAQAQEGTHSSSRHVENNEETSQESQKRKRGTDEPTNAKSKRQKRDSADSKPGTKRGKYQAPPSIGFRVIDILKIQKTLKIQDNHRRAMLRCLCSLNIAADVLNFNTLAKCNTLPPRDISRPDTNVY